MAPCTHIYEKAFFACRQKTTSVASLSRLCLITSREVNEARRPHTWSRPCAFEENKSKEHEIPPHPKHTTKSTAARRPRPPRDGVRRDASIPYSPACIGPGFVGIGLVQLSQSLKTTNVTHTRRQTNQIMAPCTHPGTKRLFCPKGKKRPHYNPIRLFLIFMKKKYFPQQLCYLSGTKWPVKHALQKTAYLPNRTCVAASLISQIESYVHPNLIIIPVNYSKARLVVCASCKPILDFFDHSAAPNPNNYVAALVLDGTRGSVRGLNRWEYQWLLLSPKFKCESTSVARELVRFSS